MVTNSHSLKSPHCLVCQPRGPEGLEYLEFREICQALWDQENVACGQVSVMGCRDLDPSRRIPEDGARGPKALPT